MSHFGCGCCFLAPNVVGVLEAFENSIVAVMNFVLSARYKSRLEDTLDIVRNRLDGWLRDSCLVTMPGDDNMVLKVENAMLKDTTNTMD